MIAKIHPGNNFGGLVNYANDIEKKDAERIAINLAKAQKGDDRTSLSERKNSNRLIALHSGHAICSVPT